LQLRGEYHLITRDDRLNTIAEDITNHFLDRGQQGKAMVVSVDKATAVRIFDNVKASWSRRLNLLRREEARAMGSEKEALQRTHPDGRGHRHGGRGIAVPELDGLENELAARRRPSE
jgi:nucleotidyltransferase/DNA polymerase involved in DNA repair